MTRADLVTCEPYGCRLSAACCVRRRAIALGSPVAFELVRRKGVSSGIRPLSTRKRVALCATCPTGAQRAESC